MDRNVGLWIDHERAIIVSASDDGVRTTTLESRVDGHPRFSGPPGAAGEKKYEQRHDEQLHRYYDDVIGQLGRPQALLIFGPGEARQELRARLSRVAAIRDIQVETEPSDKLTYPQIVAKVKAHFGLTSR